MVGQKINHYRIDQLVGRGGMGTIYRAFDLNLNRTVAIKIVHPHLAENRQFQARFTQEARTAAALDHPSIVKIFTFDAANDLVYMVMEYVGGGSLASYVRRLKRQRQTLSINETVLLCAQVADALHYAHTRQPTIVHRDIKPDNILIKDAPQANDTLTVRAVVTDFGLAKLLNTSGMTHAGAFMGTLAYMSPEQCQGLPLDARSDIYAMGIMLYQLVTGRVPFDVATPEEARHHHVSVPPPAPSQWVADLPAELERIILTAIAKQPAQRYQSAQQMAQALRTISQSLLDKPQTNGVSFMQLAPAAPSVAAETYAAPQIEWILSIKRLNSAESADSPQEFLLDRDTVMIGRTAENDIVLPSERVSRHHLQIRRTVDGWELIDLNSSNGSYLDELRLLPNMAQEWELGRTLRIGEFTLQLHREQSGFSQAIQPSQQPLSQIPAPLSTVAQTQTVSATGLFTLDVPTTDIHVLPGQPSELTVQLHNQSPQVDHIRFEVRGISADWVQAPDSQVQLMPNTPSELKLSICPDTNARAGRYSYRLTAWLDTNIGETATLVGDVIVQSVEQFRVTMHPTRIQHGDQIRITIFNDGNSPVDFSLIGSDPAEAVYFGRQGQHLEVDADDESLAVMQVSARRRPLFGSPTMMPFSMVVETQRGMQQQVEGQMTVRPIFPSWLVSLFGILLMLGLGAAAFLYNQSQQQLAAATASAEAAIISTQQAATQVAQEQNAQAESIALTRQAQGDKDGDGLTNEEEMLLGTNPNSADSDNDGISDYDEATLCTSPLIRDTDGDGLSDGDEIRRQLLPCVVDSDGDGIPDGNDPDARATPVIPTTTPLVFPTPIGGVPAGLAQVGNSPQQSGNNPQAPAAGGGSPTGPNLLPNPSFEDGHYNQDNISEFQLPVGWRIEYREAPNEFGTAYYKPETGILSAARLPENEREAFIYNGTHTLKIFKGFLPMSAAIYTELTLQPGTYELAVEFFPDIVVAYDGGSKQFATDPMAANVMLLGAQNTEWLEVNYGTKNEVSHRFTVQQTDIVRVGIDFRTIFEYHNNGFFLDNLSLHVVQ